MPTALRRDALQFGLGLIQRFLFGALVDADWTDTASFMNDTPFQRFPQIPNARTPGICSPTGWSGSSNPCRHTGPSTCCDRKSPNNVGGPRGLFRQAFTACMFQREAARPIPACDFVSRWPGGKMPGTCFILLRINRLPGRMRTTSARLLERNTCSNTIPTFYSSRTNKTNGSSGLPSASAGRARLWCVPPWSSF